MFMEVVLNLIGHPASKRIKRVVLNTLLLSRGRGYVLTIVEGCMRVAVWLE